MTEEIIIDGVNVAGCSLYLKDNGKCLRLLTDDEPETECTAICDYGCLYHKEQLKRLEQENKDFEILAKSLYKRIEELEKENEALAFRERLYKTGYKASEQENKEIYENGQIEITKLCNEKTKYCSALEEIREIIKPFAKCYTHNCINCEKYDNAHACCIKNINCYKYNDGGNSACKDFTLPTKQFYQQIFANAEYKINEALK